jgi:hypothetical protein
LLAAPISASEEGESRRPSDRRAAALVDLRGEARHVAAARAHEHKQRVTVFDDRHDSYRVEDLNRIRSMSDLIALSDKQTLRDLLAA